MLLELWPKVILNIQGNSHLSIFMVIFKCWKKYLLLVLNIILNWQSYLDFVCSTCRRAVQRILCQFMHGLWWRAIYITNQIPWTWTRLRRDHRSGSARLRPRGKRIFFPAGPAQVLCVGLQLVCACWAESGHVLGRSQSVLSMLCSGEAYPKWRFSRRAHVLWPGLCLLSWHCVFRAARARRTN